MGKYGKLQSKIKIKHDLTKKYCRGRQTRLILQEILFPVITTKINEYF